MNERAALYASSLYAVGAESGAEKEIYENLCMVKKLFDENRDYKRLLNSVQVPLEEREKLIDEAFSGVLCEYCLNFLKILAKKRIFDIWSDCFKEYEKLYFKDAGIERATITTAVELDEAKKKEIVNKISASLGKTVLADFVLDKSIVGGIVIETATSSIDASVKTKLESIKRYISK